MTSKDEALQRLRELLPPGTTVHTILRHVSRSGMSRRISAVKIGADGDTFHLDGLIEATGLFKGRDRHEGLVLSGCGMDMGFHLVYSLSQMLYPEGFGCVGKNCPSNDHTNGDRDYTPYNASVVRASGANVKENHWHKSGGYALSHRWL